jgi:hypothetical protein
VNDYERADYSLKWPSEIVRAEIERYLARAESLGITTEWCAEVKLLLEQAFVGKVPSADFQKLLNQNRSGFYAYGDEEPF